MQLKEYANRAMEALKKPETWEKIGNGIRYASIPFGAIPAGIVYATTGDAVAAVQSMQPAAYGFFLGESLISIGEYARQTRANFMQHAGRILSPAIPLAAAQFLGDNVYEPIKDLGTIAAWAAIGQGAKEIGNMIELNGWKDSFGRLGREGILKYLRESATDKDLREYAARIAAKGRHKKASDK